MAKLFYRYSTMGAGKSMEIYRIAENYKRQNKKAICLVPEIVGEIKSRTGLKVSSIPIREHTFLTDIIEYLPVDCILVDEVQFLTKEQVLDLVEIVDTQYIPVICYGLKNDFKNDLFEGSKYLLIYADKIEEIKTTCYFCNRKATMVMRIEDGKPVYEGEQVKINKDDYLPVCRKHWFKGKELKSEI